MEREPKKEIGNLKENIEDENRVDAFYDYAIERNEDLKTLPELEMKSFIGELIREIDLLEESAERDKGKFDLPDEAKNIGVVWVFSGPGTYFESRKEDRYKSYPWAKWMDRERSDHATRLIRKIAEKASGIDLKTSLSEIAAAKMKTREVVLVYGPSVIYNGTQIENQAVAKALSQEGAIIPKEKVDIIGGIIKDTIDQVVTLRLPESFKKGKEIAIVSHAPHLARIVRIINKYKPFPEGTNIRLFPVPTPVEGREEYAKIEICGTLYHSLIKGNATKDSYPYEISYTSQKDCHT